jgi:hypothetical protein
VTTIEAARVGKVVAVCADPKHRFSKTPCRSITLVAGRGIEGAFWLVREASLSGTPGSAASKNSPWTPYTPDRRLDDPPYGPADALRVDRPVQKRPEDASGGRSTRATFSGLCHGRRKRRRTGRAGGQHPSHFARAPWARASGDLKAHFDECARAFSFHACIDPRGQRSCVIGPDHHQHRGKEPLISVSSFIRLLIAYERKQYEAMLVMMHGIIR